MTHSCRGSHTRTSCSYGQMCTTKKQKLPSTVCLSVCLKLTPTSGPKSQDGVVVFPLSYDDRALAGLAARKDCEKRAANLRGSPKLTQVVGWVHLLIRSVATFLCLSLSLSLSFSLFVVNVTLETGAASAAPPLLPIPVAPCLGLPLPLPALSSVPHSRSLSHSLILVERTNEGTNERRQRFSKRIKLVHLARGDALPRCIPII